MARKCDRLVQRHHLGTRGRHPRFGLALLAQRIESVCDATRGQRRRFAAHRRSALCNVTRGEQSSEVGIGRRYGGGEEQCGLFGIDRGRLRVGRRGCKSGTVTSPQIEVEREIGSDAPRIEDTLRHELARNAQIVALLLRPGTRLDTRLGQRRRAGLLSDRLRGTEPRRSHTHVRRAAQRIIDQAVELRIPICPPPPRCRPHAFTAGERAGGQVGEAGGLGARAQLGNRSAPGERCRNAACKEPFDLLHATHHTGRYGT